MNFTLRQLRAFVAVVNTGSFTLAAESLFVTQSALSGLIKELEQSLGLRLFDRSTRSLHLSETARALYPQVEKILNDLDAVMGEVGNLKSLQRGQVRVAVPQLLACTLLPQTMAAFHKKYPHVELRLVDCPVESVVSRVFSGEVDLGIGPERHANSDIDMTPLFTMPFMAVMPADHPLAGQGPLTWRQLSGQRLITLQGQFTELLLMNVGETGRDMKPDVLMQVTFMSTALALVQAGMGLTLCLPYARSLVERYGLVMRPIADPVVQRSFWIFTRKGRTLPPAAQVFETCLKNHLDGVHT